MTHVLAIDQSTSATKAVLFDATGTVIDKASREHRQIYPQPGWVEHDAEEIWQNVLAVVGELAGRQREKLADAVGIAITNQRETIVVFDRKTGQPLSNAIVWQCLRGNPMCRELADAGHAEVIRQKTGLKLDTYFSGSKLKWLLCERPEIRALLAGGDALVGTIDTYLIYRLTSGDMFATDPTNASRTLLYDVGKLRWDEELCQLFDVPLRALGEVRESFAQFGVSDAAGRLPSKLPICGVMGDSQASLFAQCCYEPGSAKATFGSGTSVMLNIGNEFKRSGQGAVAALAWVHQGRPTYALEGIINYSSATISWLKDQLGLIHDAAESDALARSVDDNGGVYLVPAFSGLSAPYWSPDARAAIVGMTAHSRKEHIVRAALEAIAYQIRDVLEVMCRDAGVAPQVLHADGGPTRNEFLMQFTADVAGVELVTAEVPESSALGVAMAGLLGLGHAKSFKDLAAMPRTTRAYRPSMGRDKANQLYAGWQTAVKRVL
ncbi:MAG: glycerol kinase GlpK [Pirellulales bacterium]